MDSILIAYALPDPCIGYIIRESSGPRRKLVILGDTHDPSFMIPLCLSPSPSLLIHEATDAHIPRNVDPKSRRPVELVSANSLARGHSMPAMAGAFAKNVGAERLVLNHIGARCVIHVQSTMHSIVVVFMAGFLLLAIQGMHGQQLYVRSRIKLRNHGVQIDVL